MEEGVPVLKITNTASELPLDEKLKYVSPLLWNPNNPTCDFQATNEYERQVARLSNTHRNLSKDLRDVAAAAGLDVTRLANELHRAQMKHAATIPRTNGEPNVFLDNLDAKLVKVKMAQKAWQEAQ